MTTLAEDSRPLLEVDDSPADAPEEALERSYGTWALAWVAAWTFVRFVGLANVPLGNGEAYYYSWSRFLDWSYYDHPPLVAWIVRLTTAFGSTIPQAVRLGPVLCAAAFGLLFYRLAARLVRPRAALFALLIVTALPSFVASGFILNPEAPLAPLWVGFLLVVERMRREIGAHLALSAGVLLGFAFLAKYTAVLLVPAVLLYFASSRSTRRWLTRPSFYAGGAVALLLASPVLLWNASRGWPSVRLHLLDRVAVAVPVAGENTVNHLVEISSSNGTSLLQSVARVLVGQLFAYSPLLAPLLAAALVRALWRARRDGVDLFLTAFSWPVLVPLWAAMVAFNDAEQHWTMVGLVPAAIAAGGWIDEASVLAGRLRKVAATGVAASAVVLFFIIVHAHSEVVLRAFSRTHYDPKADIVNELAGWDQVRSGLTRAATAVPGPVVLAGNHYALCGRMFYEMQDSPRVYCPTTKRSAFDFFGRRETPPDATVIALTTDIREALPSGLKGRSCGAAEEITIQRGGLPVARYYIRTCTPLPVTPSGTGEHLAQLGGH